MVTHREVKEYVEKHFPTHKHQYRLLGVSKGGRSYSFLCRKCGLIQFYQKTGVLSVITVSKRKFRKRWIKNHSWHEIIIAWAQDAKEKEAWRLLSDYDEVHAN